jgi:RHS repeat-associated protein
VFENNVLSFATHDEGRIVKAAVGSPNTWEYQYFLNDHVGNVRAVVSENDVATPYSTDFESATAPFGNYNQLGLLNIFDHTDPGTTYTRSHMLTAGYNQQIGVSKSLAVNPGDVVDMEVWAKYEAPTSTSSDLSTLFQGLVAAFALQATGGTGIDGSQAYNAIHNVYPTGPWVGPSNLEDANAPRAYLNYLLFDENFNLVDLGFDQISANAQQIGASPVVPHDYLSLRVRVKLKGYLYVYVSNEQTVQTNVYFDDFKIVHHSALIQANDYYPFGLTFNSYQVPGTVPNQYQYNGKEMQDELNAGWLDYGARMYMPDIGRWGVLDPLSEKSRRWSPYASVFDNPLRFIDPDGMEALDPYIIFNGTEKKIEIWDDNNTPDDDSDDILLSINDAKNDVTTTSQGKWEDGEYDMVDDEEPHTHSDGSDTVNGTYGVGGIYRAVTFTETTTTKVRSGMGIHAGRANQNWETGRKTLGCIRVTAEGFEAIGDAIAEKGALTKLIVQNNRTSTNSTVVNKIEPGSELRNKAEATHEAMFEEQMKGLF